MSISSLDLINAARLSNAAYSNSEGLINDPSLAGWQLLGSDPVASGLFEGHQLPRPASLPAQTQWDIFFGEGPGDSNFLFDNGNAQAFIARSEIDNTLAIALR
ncbi:MAG TPA: hypothetical protein VH858_08180, partial [Hyphomicrobiales bacterium]